MLRPSCGRGFPGGVAPGGVARPLAVISGARAAVMSHICLSLGDRVLLTNLPLELN